MVSGRPRIRAAVADCAQRAASRPVSAQSRTSRSILSGIGAKALKLELIERQIEQRDTDRAGEEQEEQAEEAPAEQEALAREFAVGLGHAIKGSTAITMKSTAR